MKNFYTNPCVLCINIVLLYIINILIIMPPESGKIYTRDFTSVHNYRYYENNNEK